MTVVAFYLYRDGTRAEEVPLVAKPFDAGQHEFAWIGLSSPTERELEALKAMFGLHPLAIEDALAGKQVPKIDVYGDQLFVVAKTIHLDGDQIAYVSSGSTLSQRLAGSELPQADPWHISPQSELSSRTNP